MTDSVPYRKRKIISTLKQNYNTKTPLLKKVLVVLCALGTILLLWWVGKYCAYGFDFTDEGFYLLWIAEPQRYSWPASQFGFMYHPIYSFFGGDIVALRRVNVLITFLPAWLLCYIALDHTIPSVKESRTLRLTVSAGLATSALMMFDSALITPNYNSLNFQAFLISAIGVVLVSKNHQRTRVISWALIGVGIWLIFMAKPSSGLVFGFGICLYLILVGRFTIPLLTVVSIFSLSLLLFSMLLFDGSVTEFVRRMQLGIEFSMLQGGGYEFSQMLRLDSFELGKKTKITFMLISFTLLMGLIGSMNARPLLSFLTSIIFFSIISLLTLGQVDWTADFGQFQRLLIFAVVGAMLVCTLLLDKAKSLKTFPRHQWAIAAFFLTFPHLYAFGTNGNYWHLGGSSSFFWLLSGLILFGHTFRRRDFGSVFLPIAITVQTLTSIILQSGIENPYRQPQPLRLNSSIIEIGEQKSSLILSSGYADYITKAVSAAKEAKFQARTPVVDLTGQSPGIIYALGAESIGQAWIIGGYPGSAKFAEAALAITSCEKISRAWILHEPNGPRSIPTSVMDSVGIDFFSTHKKVNTWQIPRGAGGYEDRHLQELYKPINSVEIMLRCEFMRQNKKSK